MRTLTARVVALLVVLALGAPGLASAATPLEKLEDAQKRLEKVRDDLDQVSKSCERDEDRIDEIVEQVAVTRDAVDEAAAAVDAQAAIVEESRQQLAVLEGEAAEVRERSNNRVVELYKRGGGDSTLNNLLRSSSTEQALSTAQMFNVIEHGDREAIEELTAAQTAADAQRKLYEEQQRAYERALSQRETLIVELEALRETFEGKLAACNKKVDELEQEEQIAASDERKLASAIRVSDVPLDVPRAVSRGGWSVPASGTFTSGFGYRWGRLHAGVDIAAPIGTPIHAAKGGVVSYAGVMGGYGNIIVINHGGGMTTRYAHQSALAVGVGTTVTAGQRIGSVGNTGASTGPHLHFEVRINDAPQNPMNYLP